DGKYACKTGVERLCQHALVQIRTAVFKKEKDAIYELILNVNRSFTADRFPASLISITLSQVQALIISDEFERAYDLVDVIHALPEISITQNRDMDAYWKDFVVPYHVKWNSDFFEAFHRQVLDM
ncbi:MAG: hypothetical protein NC084_11220, partial [Bacteroides sp.]|nr:hypothetical protein [Eubacterium sp.]MCM1419514.1 hypothetical protein [Roseburia sp.]MCM1463261.1 hypothetical protein [Bacteroides sp.]